LRTELSVAEPIEVSRHASLYTHRGRGFPLALVNFL